MADFIIIFSSTNTLESGGVGTHLRYLIKETELNYDSNNYKIILGMNKVDLVKVKLTYLIYKIFYPKYSKIVYLNFYSYYMSKRLKKTLYSIDVKKFDNIVIHCHERQSALAATLICNESEIKNIKIIQTLHAPFSEQYKLSDKTNNLIYNYARIIDIGLNGMLNKQIAVDKKEKEIADNLAKYDPNNTKIIPNAINTEDLDQQSSKNPIKEEFGITKYFIIARHLFEKNGIIYGIMGYHEYIKEYGNDYKLIIMGSGTEKRTLQNYIETNNLSESIKIIGKKNHTEAIQIIKNAYLSIIPSIPIGDYIEATSLTMLESMYLGIPVLASNIGGLAETISDKTDGILFDAKNVKAIKDAIELIMKDKNLYTNISVNAKQKIQNYYSSKSWYQQIQAIYFK